MRIDKLKAPEETTGEWAKISNTRNEIGYQNSTKERFLHWRSDCRSGNEIPLVLPNRKDIMLMVWLPIQETGVLNVGDKPVRPSVFVTVQSKQS